MNQIRAGAILNYLIIGLNTIVGLAYTPYMLRCLGQTEYGLYSLVASIIAYLTILDFGFGNAIVRYTAKYRAEEKHEEQWRMFGMFLIVFTIIGVIALSIGLILYYKIDLLFDNTMTAFEIKQAQIMMLLLSINMAFTFPLSIFGSIITAYEDFIFQKILQITRLLLCTGTIVVLLGYGYKAISMVVVQTVFNLGVLIANYVYCKKNIKIKISFKGIKWTFLKEIGVYSFWIFLSSIIDRIYWSTGQFVLGAISGTLAVAVFSVAITLQQMYMAFSGAISNVLLPRIVKIVHNNKSTSELSSIFIKAGRLQAIIMLLVLFGFIVFGKKFIEYWAGDGYIESFYIALLFFFSLFIPLVQSVGFCILQAKNCLKFRSLSYLIIAIVSLLGQIILSKEYGAIGCSIAISFALLLGQGLIMNFYYQKYQQLNIISFWKEILKLAIFPFMLSFLWVILDLNKFLVHSIGTLLVGMSIFTLIYFIGQYYISMNKDEQYYIISAGKYLKKKYAK